MFNVIKARVELLLVQSAATKNSNELVGDVLARLFCNEFSND